MRTGAAYGPPFSFGEATMGELKVTKPDADKKAPVLLKYDYWDANEERHMAGDIIELPVKQARALVDEGKAERADPMPGEE